VSFERPQGSLEKKQGSLEKNRGDDLIGNCRKTKNKHQRRGAPLREVMILSRGHVKS